jgi:hypothetical protein
VFTSTKAASSSATMRGGWSKALPALRPIMKGCSL